MTLGRAEHGYCSALRVCVFWLLFCVESETFAFLTFSLGFIYAEPAKVAEAMQRLAVPNMVRVGWGCRLSLES